MLSFKKTALYLIFSIILINFLSGCSGERTTEEFLESYSVRIGTTVSISNPNGDITVTGWDGDKVEIYAFKESMHGQEALDEVDIFIEVADEMIIRTEHPSQQAKVSVSYQVKLPENVFLGIAEGSNGDIKVENLSGNAVLTTSNGSITAVEVNGTVSARSSNGDIKISGVRGLGILQTSNGNIDAELPRLPEDLDIKTSNGSITLSLAPELEADLAAKTSNGSVSYSGLNIETGEIEQTSLIGTINGGGSKINIVTSNGSIELVPLK